LFGFENLLQQNPCSSLCLDLFHLWFLSTTLLAFRFYSQFFFSTGTCNSSLSFGNFCNFVLFFVIFVIYSQKLVCEVEFKFVFLFRSFSDFRRFALGFLHPEFPICSCDLQIGSNPNWTWSWTQLASEPTYRSNKTETNTWLLLDSEQGTEWILFLIWVWSALIAWLSLWFYSGCVLNSSLPFYK